jgi:3-dehydroquinate synthase
MVDAAIGGKTGINHRLGKNLIGAFWQPEFVGCDLNYLQTLSRRDMVAGLGEIVKYAGLLGGRTPGGVRRYIDAGDLYDIKRLEPLVLMGARCKAGIVAADEREAGMRKVLNLGHTFAHGIESALGYGKLLHGEAVLLGLLACVELSRRVRPRSRRSLQQYDDLLASCLPLVPQRGIVAAKVMAAMKMDKKRASDRLNFVLLASPGEPFIENRINRRDVRAALDYALRRYLRK